MMNYTRSLINVIIALASFLTGCAEIADPVLPTDQQSQTAETREGGSVQFTPTAGLEASMTGTPTSTATLSPTPAVTISATSTPPQATIAPEVSAYLEEAYTIMYENSIRRDLINWEGFRTRFEAKINAVQPESFEDAHGIIDQAVGWLGDNHSVFMAPGEVDTWVGDLQVPASRFEAQLLEGAYGYISVPSFSSGSDEANNEFATVLQAEIAEIDQQQPCGWIIDLRSNFGGNMWPMIAGIGPILGEGVFGENIRADGGTIVWRYEDGQGWWGDELLAQTNDQPVVLHEELPPSAILLGRGTASAGEAVAIAFKGRPNTRFFGQATAGLTTAPEPYSLNDGAIIFLSDSYMGDRNGRAYTVDVAPDEELYLGDSFDAPIEWLSSQAACN